MDAHETLQGQLVHQVAEAVQDHQRRIGPVQMDFMEKQGLEEESAKALIKDIDQTRENYIQRYTGTSRYDARNYDLVLKADGHTEEQLVNIILSYIG